MILLGTFTGLLTKTSYPEILNLSIYVVFSCWVGCLSKLPKIQNSLKSHLELQGKKNGEKRIRSMLNKVCCVGFWPAGDLERPDLGDVVNLLQLVHCGQVD